MSLSVPVAAEHARANALPVAALAGAVVDALRTHGAAVVIAPPGAGKSTLLPPALLDAGRLGNGRLVMLQPRRVAARAVARRIAQLRGGRLGDEIGYRVRFEDRTSAATRIEVVTEGLLTRRLQSDPFLEGVSCIVLDEFHERSLHADLALALLAEVRRDARPDLQILVMSATLDPGPVAAFLGGCPVLTADARPYPVELVYERESSQEPVLARAARAVRRCLADPLTPDGHVLVFLPGRGEINELAGLLADLRTEPPGRIEVLPLHGGLSPEAQDRALQPPEPGVRKVVLATNIAETSVTIEGVQAVIDTGLARVPRFEPRLGLERLERVRISRASAEQRAGRAGRTGPGRCFRLWTALEHNALPAVDVPELLRTDLARTVLEIRGWGAEPTTFGFFERPPAEALEQADGLLRRLGFVDARGLTPPGRAALAMPLHPRLAAVVAAGHAAGVLRAVCTAAALVNERDVLRDPPQVVADSDLALRLDALAEAEAGGLRPEACRRWGLDAGAAREVIQVRDQLFDVALRTLGRTPTEAGRARETAHDGSKALAVEQTVLRSLLAGFGDRVAQRRTPRGTKFKLAGGGGAVLDGKSVVRDAELVLAIGLEAAPHGKGGEHRIRIASALSPTWLPRTRGVETRWDAEREAVAQARVERFLDLVLAEHPAGADADPDAAALLLAAQAALAPSRAFDPESTGSFVTRVRFLAEHMPELALPRFEALDTPASEPPDWLLGFCTGRRSFSELRRADLAGWLRGTLTPTQQQALDRQAPERLALPAGRHGRLTYLPGEPPVLAAKLQWFFGLDRTPTVADGRVRVRLHLLAPNGRPAQVTQDLEGFWRGSWSLVRKELRGRYPRHAWPEDPSAAWREP